MSSKPLPHNLEAEQGLLGSMLLDPSKIGEVGQLLCADHFYAPHHQTIFSELWTLWAGDQPIDLVTFTNYLRDKHILDKVGGASCITSLFTFVPSAVNYRHYLEIVKEKAYLRSIIAAATLAANRAHLTDDDVSDIISSLQSELIRIANPNGAEEQPSTATLVAEAVSAIEDAAAMKGKIPGLLTGLKDLDRKLGGFRPSQLIVISADTGEGKTALSLNILEHLGIHDNIPCGIISMEMPGTDLCERIIAAHGRIDIHNVRQGGGSQKDFESIAKSAMLLAKAPIHFRHESDMDSLKLRAIARQLKQQHKIELLVVDYIQLMVQDGKNDENRERMVAGFAQALKQTAVELGIVVIGLSQVTDGKLRESRAIGHHSDKVLLIQHEDEDESARIIVTKNRSGPIGSVPTTFLRFCASFVPYAKNGSA
jgi:replicative DNA helicase